MDTTLTGGDDFTLLVYFWGVQHHLKAYTNRKYSNNYTTAFFAPESEEVPTFNMPKGEFPVGNGSCADRLFYIYDRDYAETSTYKCNLTVDDINQYDLKMPAWETCPLCLNKTYWTFGNATSYASPSQGALKADACQSACSDDVNCAAWLVDDAASRCLLYNTSSLSQNGSLLRSCAENEWGYGAVKVGAIVGQHQWVIEDTDSCDN